MSAALKLQLSSVSEDSAQVRVVESPAGEPRHAMVRPFDPVTERALLKLLEKSDLEKCDLDDQELAGLSALGLIRDGHLLGPQARNRIVGRQLFESLFPADADANLDVRGALEAALNLSRTTETAVPVQLRFDHDAVDLARLPWELICDAAGRHLVAEGLLRLTRYITFGQAISPFPIADYLDLLVITSRPEDTAYLDPDAERQAIKQAFDGLQTAHRVRVQHLRPATRDALVRAVNARAYDVVHFDGHGALARRCPFCEQFQPADMAVCLNPECGAYGTRLDEGDLESCLAFERGDTGSTKHLVSASDLATVLSDSHVRLFVASACQTGTVGGTSVFVSAGPSLIQTGVPAVVTMQFSVPAVAAAQFVAEFYAGLARGESIAAATAAGRRLLFDRGMWYIPAVYLRNRDGEGFLFHRRAWHHLSPAAAEAVDWASLRPRDASPYKFLSPYEITDRVVFHGRDGDTQKVLEEILHRRYAVLHGLPSVGKTSLVNAGLIPALIDRKCAFLTIRECDGDPVEVLRREAASSPEVEVDMLQAADLAAVVDVLQMAVDRTLVIIFDQFDSFLRSATVDQLRAFAKQLAAYAGKPCLRHCCVLLVMRRDAVGSLQAFQAQVPDIFQTLIALEPLTGEQARRAIEEPLKQQDPPMEYDSGFLEETLLWDLRTEPEEDAINPAHLQIVCHHLYQAARRQHRNKIESDLYPEGGIGQILTDFLQQSMGRLEPDKQEPARALLKRMVSVTGERLFLTPGELVKEAGDGPTEEADAKLTGVQVVLDALLRDGLLETLAREDGELTYSLSHHLLAAEVHGWFDREEALNGIAQEALDRAWQIWYGQVHAPAAEEGEREPDVQPLLVAKDRLHVIRARRDDVTIDGPQICLLLHSAVHHRCDVAYWASELRNHEEAPKLLKKVQLGQVDGLDKPERKRAILCAKALGLSPDDLGEGALARAAVGGSDGRVRHTAALALGALGMETIHDAQATLAGLRWRRMQVLARIKAAGLPLPQLPLLLQAGVTTWATGLAIWAARLQILAESLAAGLGAGLGLGLCLLLSVFVVLRDLPLTDRVPYLFRSLYLQPIGFVLGVLAVVMLWLASCSLRSRSGRVQVVGRIVGFWLGFLLGLVLFWLPLDLYARILADKDLFQMYIDLFQTYILGGSLWGLGIILGREALAGFRSRTAPGRALLGGGLGGALGCVLTVLVGITVPLVEPSGSLLIRGGEAILAGLGLGGGLAGGWELGAELWDRLQRRQGLAQPRNGTGG